MADNQMAPPSMEQMQAQERNKQEQEEMIKSFMTQITTPEARERLSRIAIVKPEKARSIEQLLIQRAQQGHLKSKVDEKQLIELLERTGAEATKRTKVVSIRRRTGFDDEDDDDDDDDF